jgi:hypothetical protein
LERSALPVWQRHSRHRRQRSHEPGIPAAEALFAAAALTPPVLVFAQAALALPAAASELATSPAAARELADTAAAAAMDRESRRA